jgi:hypothetical protein
MQVVFLGKFSRDLDDLTDADLKSPSWKLFNHSKRLPRFHKSRALKR